MKPQTSQYWASVEREKIGAEMLSKVEKYNKHLESSGILKALKKSYDTYYGNIEIADVDQSLKAMHVNHYANLVRHIHVMVTSTRPAWEVRSVNTDSESQAATMLAGGLLDYYHREKKLDQSFIEAVEKCLFLKEGWISLGWNVTGGEIYGKNPETGDPIYEGDVEFKVHTLPDVIRDFTRKNMAHEWIILRDQLNKWNLAAKHPELADKLIALKGNKKEDLQFELASVSPDEISEDLIPVYTLRHDKTDAMPEGRLTIIAGEDIVLFDGPLPYKKHYVFPITSSKVFETAFGHSQAMDLLPIQDAFNMTVSSILTNQAANAVQNFQIPKGASPALTKFEGGMNVWEYDAKAGKLEAMDLLKTAPEVFNFANFLVQQSELVSGVNQIARGNAPATLSGTAMALIQQQAIQFSSGVQMGLNSLSESVGTGLLELLQTFAVVPRMALIAGKTKRSYMRKFKGDDLKGVSRVFVDSANPLTKTAAGRVEIANQLLQQGIIKTAEQYIMVLTTGNLEPIYEYETSQQMLMRSENEWLLEGKQVQVLITDDDALHVLEHACVLNSPEARENPTVVNAAIAHIQAHIAQAKTKDTALSGMLKQTSFAAPPMPPPNQGGPAPQGPGPAPVMDNQNPITQQAEAVALPSPAQAPELGV